MSKKIRLAAAAVAAPLAVVAMPATAQPNPKPLATLFKNPQCSCCDSYAKYLESNGYQVKLVPSHDLPLIQQRQGIPAGFEGCHTTLVGGYFVDGHVPIEAFNRLLQERPKINGITVPGMPPGTPGMGGPKRGPLKIYAVEKGGKTSVFEVA